MRKITAIAVFALCLFGNSLLFAQLHVSVPVSHSVYYILDQAEMRGLCAPLPAVKPYTRSRIIEAINEILAAEPRRFGTLSDSERKMLDDVRGEFTKIEAGLDPWKGMYRIETEGKKGVRFSGDIGIAMDSLNSGAYYQEDKKTYLGTDTWGTLFFKGDVGEQFSFVVDFSAGIMKAHRGVLGTGDSYATELAEEEAERGYVNRELTIYSQPKAFFPYTYQKRWDGFIFSPGNLSASGMEPWPEGLSIGPSMLAEMTGSAFGDMLLLRFGRFQREWGAMIPGSSIAFNAAARPFLGVELLFNPAPWFAFSSLTGVLEYYNTAGISDSSMTFQNAFSIQQIEVNYGNNFHLDFGSTVIWPKRFELGYLFPLLDNFFYQNFIGDHDNMGIYMNIRGRYPGLGSIWFSFFMDEMEISSMKSAFKLDRHMFAYQTGIQTVISGLPFASISLSYTKVEPYNYTHTRNFMPWYGENTMDTSYTNNGVCLGYYLPPNSDEVKLRVDVPLWFKTAGHFQYQLIRHGADYGSQQVDGSSLISELDPVGRGDKPSLGKSFLKDGAYQWMHIIKIGGEYKFGSLPLTIFGDMGIAYSYFTTISQEKYDKYHPTLPDGEGQPRSSATGDYFKSTAYILTLGFRVFK